MERMGRWLRRYAAAIAIIQAVVWPAVFLFTNYLNWFDVSSKDALARQLSEARDVNAELRMKIERYRLKSDRLKSEVEAHEYLLQDCRKPRG